MVSQCFWFWAYEEEFYHLAHRFVESGYWGFSLVPIYTDKSYAFLGLWSLIPARDYLYWAGLNVQELKV